MQLQCKKPFVMHTNNCEKNEKNSKYVNKKYIINIIKLPNSVRKLNQKTCHNSTRQISTIL